MLRSLVALCVFSLFAFPALAANVAKVKGKSALIDLKGDPAAPGDSFFALSPEGKRVGLIKISKVKGEKAIGKIVKGRAAAGMSIELQPSKVTAGGGHKRSTGGTISTAGRSYWGGLFGFAMDSMDVNVNDSITGAFKSKAALSGNGLSAKGLFDYEVFSQVWFRFTAGLEMFKVAGPKQCGTLNGQVCDANINYLSMDFIGRYVFLDGSFRPWAGAGVGLLFPMSKTASALSAQSISTTNVLMVLGGFDYFVSPNFYIPVSVEYGMLPKSDEVAASWIAFRVGAAFPF